MVKTTTIAELQDALKGNPETSDIDVWSDDDQKSAPNPLAALAEHMVRERPAGDGHVGDPFDGLSIDVDPADAFGLVQANVTAWLEERGRWASPIEISHKAEQLMAEAQNQRPGPVASGTYTVGPDGLVNGFEPDAAPAEQTELPDMPATGLRVPRSTEFDADGWADSTALYQRAQALIERHPDELEHLEGMSLGFLWKLKGGKSRGRPVMGQCVKAGGMLKHFAGSTFLIWLAADHVLAARYGDREIEALLFRQLLAAGVAEVDENTGRGGGATLVPPDVQAYAAELRVYGLWESQLKSAAQAFRQAPLFDAAANTYPDPIDIEYDQEDESATNEGEKEEAPSSDGPQNQEDDSLVCSVCGKPVEVQEVDNGEVYQDLTLGDAVVLCEACGEDGILDEGDEAGG